MSPQPDHGPTPRSIETLNHLEATIVRFTTVTALVFFVGVAISWLVTTDPQLLMRSLSPAAVGGVGLLLLRRRQPRALVQMLVGAGTIAIYAGFADVGSREPALLGLLSIGLVATLLVRRRVAVFIAAGSIAVGLVAFWWTASAHPERGPVDALGAGLMFAFTGSLIAWLKSALLAESRQRAATHEALAASQERFRRAFDVAATAVLIVSARDGRFLKLNDAARALIGRPPDRLQQMTVRDLIHPDDRDALSARLADLGHAGERAFRDTYRYVRSSGSTGHAMVSGAAIPTDEGSEQQVVVHLVDTTDQIRAERRLIDMLGSKDELIASVSHELRTPLTAVLGYAEVLQDSTMVLARDERDDIVRLIVGQASDLSDIVEDLLVAARMNTNEIPTSEERVALRAEVGQVLESISRQVDVDHITVEGGHAVALADPVRVRQIIRNLVTNALRYGGPNVGVAVERSGSEVSVSVVDDGAGIDESLRQTVFEPYERGHAAEGLTASVGLGLTVARKLARLMNGDLTYTYEDGRSRFRLSLPDLGDAAGLSPAGQVAATS